MSKHSESRSRGRPDDLSEDWDDEWQTATAELDQPILCQDQHTLSLQFDAEGVQSQMHMKRPYELMLGYTRTMMGFLLFAPEPRQVLMIGLGGGSMPKYGYAFVPSTVITVVEINPQVIGLRHTFRIPDDDERLQVLCADGAEYVRFTKQRFDAIVVDGFTADGQPDQLCSQRFYSDCYRCLKPEGVLAVNLHHVDRLEHNLRHMGRAFKRSLVVIDSDDSCNKVAFAYKGEMDAALARFDTRLQQLREHHSLKLHLSAQLIRRDWQAGTSSVLP